MMMVGMVVGMQEQQTSGASSAASGAAADGVAAGAEAVAVLAPDLAWRGRGLEELDGTLRLRRRQEDLDLGTLGGHPLELKRVSGPLLL